MNEYIWSNFFIFQSLKLEKYFRTTNFRKSIWSTGCNMCFFFFNFFFELLATFSSTSKVALMICTVQRLKREVFDKMWRKKKKKTPMIFIIGVLPILILYCGTLQLETSRSRNNYEVRIGWMQSFRCIGKLEKGIYLDQGKFFLQSKRSQIQLNQADLPRKC